MFVHGIGGKVFAVPSVRSFRVLALVLLLAAGFIRAQETINFASLSGRIIDATGAVVEGAQVTVENTDTNVSNTAETGREGRFRFPYLQVGPYKITVSKQGFSLAARSATLTVGSAFDLTIPLEVGAEETTVQVSGESPILETDRSQIAGTISQTEVNSLPLNGRSFLDLTLLLPGVSSTNTSSTQLFSETSAVPGQGISINSQRNFSNSFIVDGLSANDDAAGIAGTFYGLDVVRELQVVTSGGQAEFGRAMGGYINMVTKSGTNLLHGDAYGFFRNQRLNAANPLTNTKLPLTQAQYGASLGGPIVKDRTFYFANFERRDLNQSGLITIAPANVATINTQLTAIGLQGSQITTGLYPNPVHNSNFFGKVDHQLRPGDQLTVRYNLYRVNSDNSRGAGALSATSAAAGLEDIDQTIAAGNVLTLSPYTVNETRAQFTNSDLKAPPNDPTGPAVRISGIASFGTLSTSPTARSDKLYEVVNNLSHQAGTHALRAGVDFLGNDLTIKFPRAVRGSYSFSSLPDFLASRYTNSGFTQTFGNSVVTQMNPNIGMYAQDEWKLHPRFTLNTGVRYDLQFMKDIYTDINNVSPRAGFSWTPSALRRMLIRGGFGLYYDRVPLRALANALLSSGNTTAFTDMTQASVSLSPGQTGAPAFPNILSSLPPDVLMNFTTMDRNMQNAYSEQVNLEVEQQVGEKGAVSVTYRHLRGRHLIISVNQNVPVCAAAGGNNGCRPNPSYGNNSQYSPLADSQYDGVSISFVQRPTRWGSYRVSYTYSKALDDVGEFFFSSPLDNFNIRQDWGRSDDDQRHRVVFDGSIHDPEGAANNVWEHLSHGFRLSGILQYSSPLPFNVLTGANTIQGTAARPRINGVYIGRNTGIGFDSFTLDARLSRTFAIGERLRLDAMAEAFNALNHRNNLFPNGTFGSGSYPSNPSPTFRNPTAVGDARSLQLALRLSF
jgi:hypothetical protein